MRFKSKQCANLPKPEISYQPCSKRQNLSNSFPLMRKNSKLSNYSAMLSDFPPYNQIIPREGAHLKIIKIYDFPWKAKKFWQQEAHFELLLPELFDSQGFSVRKKSKSPKPIVLTVSDFCGAGNRTRTGTLFTARDFKSLVSTDFTMPAKALHHDSILLGSRQVTADPDSG